MTQVAIVSQRFVDHWLEWMIAISWQTALIVAIVTLLGVLTRRCSARFRYALWTLVPLRLVLPPTLALATGWAWWLMPSGEPPRSGEQPILASAIAEDNVPVPTPAEQLRPDDRSLTRVSESDEGVSASSFVTTSPANKPAPKTRTIAYGLRLGDVLFAAWLAGCAVIAMRLLIGYRKVRRLVRDAEPANGETAELLGACRKDLGMRQRVRIALSPHAQTPLVTGLFRPLILLPMRLADDLSRAQLRAVLMHELQHVARGDLWHQLGTTLIHGVYFFHPCVWWATRQMRRLREQACDEATVAALGGCREDYGTAVVRVAERMAGQPPRFALGIADSDENISLRLRRILDPRLPIGRRLGWPTRMAILMVASVLIPCAAAPGVAQQATEASDEPAAEQIEVSGTVLDADGKPASDAEITFRADYSPWTASTRSDASGRFRLSVRLPPVASEKLARHPLASFPDELGRLGIQATGAAGDQVSHWRKLTKDDSKLGKIDAEVQMSRFRTIEIGVVDSRMRAVVEANVAVQSTYDSRGTIAVTDETGVARVRVPQDARIMSVIAWKAGDGLDYKLNPGIREYKPFPTDDPEVLVLRGASPMSVHVRDREGNPVSEATVNLNRFIKASEPGPLPRTFRNGLIVDTDALGVASIAWMPSWQDEPVYVTVTSPTHATAKTIYDPGGDTAELDIVLETLVPLRGRVLDGDGRPQPGIKVAAYAAGEFDKSRYSRERTDANGNYELRVPPNQNLLVVVDEERFAAASHSGFAAEPGRPIEGKDFVLRAPTRIVGRFRDQPTLERGSVALTQLGREFEDEELAGRLAASAAGNAPILSINTRTRPMRVLRAVPDDQGRFSLSVGDGVYVIDRRRPGEPSWIVVDGESEIELDFR